MRYSNSFAGTLRNFRRAPALFVFAGAAGLVLTAFAPAPSTGKRAAPPQDRQFAQEKGKGKANAQKAKSAEDGAKAKGGETGQCPPGKTFIPGRGRGAGGGGNCS